MDVANYLLKYGLGGVIVAVIVVIVTGLLKSPLKKVAVAKAEEKGVDKEVFTRWLALIPLFLAFVGAVVNVSACNGWANPFLEGFDWKTTAVEAAELVTVTDTYWVTNDGDADQEIETQVVAPGETVELDMVTTSTETELVLMPVENVTPGVWTVTVTAADGYGVEGLTEGELSWESHTFTVSQP